MAQAVYCAAVALTFALLYIPYIAMGNTPVEFTKWALLLNMAYFLAALVHTSQVRGARSQPRAILMSNWLVVTIVINAWVAIASIYLFWAKADVVRIAYGRYPVGDVLLANFALHVLPLFLAATYLTSYTDAHRTDAQRAARNIPADTYLCIITSLFLLFTYMACMDTAKVYGVSFEVGVFVMPVCVGVCATVIPLRMYLLK